MFLDFIFGFLIAIPMLAGILGYPWGIWKRLDKRFLNKRGVALWKKMAVGLVALIPSALTLIIFGLLQEWLEVGGSEAAWKSARATAPRLIPPEAYPMAIGMLLGVLGLAPFFDKFIHKLPYLNKPLTDKSVSLRRTRTEEAELHRLEWHVKTMFLPLRTYHIGAVPLLEIPAFASAPLHVKNRFYQEFINTDFLVVTKKNVTSSNVGKKDISYALDTVLVAEDEDCLGHASGVARAPLVKLQGKQLLSLLKGNAKILINQPEIQITISSQEIKDIKRLGLN